jgi:hypothetical protein
MSKGKYKRKKNHGQNKAQKRPAKRVLMDPKEEDSDNQAKPAANSAHQTANDIQPRWYIRLYRWAKDGKTFTDWCLAAFTFVLAVAAIYQFVIMRGQLKVMSGQLEAMRIDERPWMKITADFLPIQAFSPDIAKLHVFNTGKTPASRISVKMAVETVENGRNPKLDFGWPIDVMTTGVVFPNTQTEDLPIRREKSPFRDLTLQGPGPAEPDPITQEEMIRFGDNKIFFVVYARIEYFDSSNVQHWTNFCAFKGHAQGTVTTQTVSAQDCTNFNAVDSNKK